MAHAHHDHVPAWSWLVPAGAAVLIALKLSGIVSESSAIVLTIAAVFLAAAVFASVHHAEVLAAKVGEPLGSIILAAAVTIIEVALIVSIMLSTAEGAATVARDTVYSALMIVLNGVIGLSLVLGGRRHHEQTFQLPSASSALAVLGTLGTLVLVLPNFTEAGGPRQFSSFQLVVIGAVSLALYGVFIFVQTIRHRDYFMEAKSDSLEDEIPAPSGSVTLTSAILLPVSLAAVVLLAKILSYPLDNAIAAAGLPKAFVGVVIAAVVLLPEGIASVRSAIVNRLQNSVNLGLGSALASIGMTIPVVTAVSIFADKQLTLGLSPAHQVLLVLTLFVSTITLGTGRTTVLQGVVHLGIFAVFIVLSAIP
ncbi:MULTISPECIES: ionic transporter y4hA [unclassified Beijerinckia]|uniref:calcium:proton antiporter n=1 Tax=unclassified Beijerinckia TaxID=2638183 RepID=UPI000B891FA0|nr:MULTISPECIES: ionic transporter y4hA [unclassified Beijerinckia]